MYQCCCWYLKANAGVGDVATAARAFILEINRWKIIILRLVLFQSSPAVSSLLKLRLKNVPIRIKAARVLVDLHLRTKTKYFFYLLIAQLVFDGLIRCHGVIIEGILLIWNRFINWRYKRYYSVDILVKSTRVNLIVYKVFGELC